MATFAMKIVVIFQKIHGQGNLKYGHIGHLWPQLGTLGRIRPQLGTLNESVLISSSRRIINNNLLTLTLLQNLFWKLVGSGKDQPQF